MKADVFTHSATFPKREHLCLKRDIEVLFTAGSRAVSCYPVRCVYREVARDESAPVKVLLSVAKRRLHHAVDRNRAKRQLREAYRRRKNVLLEAQGLSGKGLHLAFIWLSDQPADSRTVATAVEKTLRRIADRYHTAPHR